MSSTPAAVTIVECVEYETIEVDARLWLSEGFRTEFNSEINGRDILRATVKNGALRLQATSYVGVIPLNDRVVVRVRPRVPIANLTRMVVETGHEVLALSAFREYAGRGSADDWAMDLYTGALLDHLETLSEFGLLRAYRRHEGEGHYPHGQINFGRTLQRFAASGVLNKAQYSWHERSVDIPANRCIKAAMEVSLQHLMKTREKPRRGDRARIARLAGHFRSFDEVTEDPTHSFLQDLQVQGVAPLPDSRSYYRPALDLAVLILRDIGIALDLGGDDVELGSLLIDTNALFEKFVRVSLVKQAARRGWAIDVLDGNTAGSVDLYSVPDNALTLQGRLLRPLAARNPGRAQPDVVLRATDGTDVLIAEVKNTVHGKEAAGADSLPQRSEVEQAVTYALRYGLPYAILVHPWSRGSKGLVYVGRVRSIDVYDFRLDLSSDVGIDASLDDMADAFAAIAGIADHTTTAA